MPLRFVRGNLLLADADTLVNPVNCVGVQGAGLARQFREHFPDLDVQYRAACRLGMLTLGNPLLSADGRVLWFPTKHHWRERSRLHDIDRGLQRFVIQWGEDPRSWAFPALGCGLGGLDWRPVRQLMECHLVDVAGNVTVYQPLSADRERDDL